MFSVLIVISISICMQYWVSLKPCVLCIYQRCALFGIIIAGIIAIINPNSSLRFFSMFIWLYSALKGSILSKTHINMILYPSPFYMCELFVQFPKWLPLHKWFPIIFNANSGDCSSYKWYFLSIEMSQWMLIIFLIYLILAILTVISQFIRINTK